MIVSQISDNLEEVYKRVDAAAKRSGRSGKDITVIAVTKTYPVEAMNEAIEWGVTDIGENRPQEIRDKYAGILPVKWHQIGHLQSNKIKYIIDKVCLIHSVDSLSLMDEIDKHAKKHGIVMDILIEINIAKEESKHGVYMENLDELLIHAGELNNIKVRGLMTVAPKSDNNITNRLYFDNMKQKFIDIQSKTYDNVSMDYLSMGMSGDFEEAIECGSNMVRIGTAIFGKRNYN